MTDLTNKAVFIANGAHPVAQACAAAFRQQGAKACLVNADGGDLRVEIDVQDQASWVAAFSACHGALGGPDVLVIPSFGGVSEGIEALKFGEFVAAHRAMAVPAFLAQNQGIIAMRSARVAGAVIHILPAASRVAVGNAAAVCTAAAGILFSSKSAALECAKAKDGIVVNALLAGPVEGAGDVDYGVPVDSVSPQQIAAAAVFYATDGAAYMTGMDLPIDNGLVAQ
jgi:NAD(P)-dependent dehydrogenase (short-subunit alcohol dehydrogenase family)